MEKSKILDLFTINNNLKQTFLYNNKFFLRTKLENKINHFIDLVNVNFLASGKRMDLFKVLSLLDSFKFDYLVDIVAVDMLSKFNKFYGRFKVRYIITSIKYFERLFIDLSWYKDKWIFSVESLFLSASWSEREIWDLFGIFFLLSKDLRRLLTDYGFTGFPFRRDYPVVGFKELEFNYEIFELLYIPVNLSQENRVFEYDSSWMRKEE